MGQKADKIRGVAIIFLVLGVQGVLFAAYLGISMMKSVNPLWLLPILLIALVYITTGVSSISANKLKPIISSSFKNFKKFILWPGFWIGIFLLVAYIGISIEKPFNLLVFLSIDRLYASIAIPLLLISVLLIEGLLVGYFYSYFYNSQVSERLETRSLQSLVGTKVIIFISLAVFLSRNLWSPALGDLYRAVREISSYVLLSGFFVLILQRVTFPISIIDAKNRVIDYLKSSWFKLTMAALLFFVGFIVIIRSTGLGITYDPKFWNAAGVPILFEVVLVLAAGIILFLDIRQFIFWKINLNTKIKTVLLVLLVWLGAVLFWNGIELTHTYFAPKPQLPNTATYPFSDASYFDIGAQYTLLGRGVNNSAITDRPILMLLFSLFHLVGGQEYFDVIFVQICFLALIPVLIFLLGKKMHSPLFGVSLALFVIFKEAVALQTASTLSITNVKVLMSELPTALCLILLTYFLYKWFNTQNEDLNALSAGGVLGITLMVRANVFPILFSIGIFSILFYAPKKRWKAWLRTNLFFLFAVILVLLPYSIQTYRTTGTPFILKKIYDVIDRSYSYSDPSHVGKVEGTGAVNYKLMPSLTEEQRAASAVSDLIFQVGNYYARNVIMTFMAYPTIPGAAPISTLEEQAYWKPDEDWQIKLTWYQWGMVAINLSVLAIGMTAAFKTVRWNGLTPLMVFLIYHVANAAARTAGGRYLVPVDWALHFYYLLGIFSISAFVAVGTIPGKSKSIDEDENAAATNRKSGNRAFILVLLIFGVIGSSPVLVNLIPDRLADLSEHEAGEFLNKVDGMYFESVGYEPGEIRQFIIQDGGEAISGLSLYPRFYPPGESDAVSAYVPEMPVDTQRVYFILLSKNSQYHVNLLQQDQRYEGFPHAEQLLVIGCNRGLYFDAFFVFNLEDQSLTSVRTPSMDLTCQQ